MPTWVPVIIGVGVVIISNAIAVVFSFMRFQAIYTERQIAFEKELQRLATEITNLDKNKVPYPVYESTQGSLRELLKMLQDTVLQRLDRLEHHIDREIAAEKQSDG